MVNGHTLRSVDECWSRGDETQTKEKIETPHVVSYKIEVQIFSQTGESSFKGVVVFPVREIGDVIFADFLRLKIHRIATPIFSW